MKAKIKIKTLLKVNVRKIVVTVVHNLSTFNTQFWHDKNKTKPGFLSIQAMYETWIYYSASAA